MYLYERDEVATDLVRRIIFISSGGSRGPFPSWGKWAIIAAIAGTFVLIMVILLLMGRIGSARNIRQGAQPLKGTGWLLSSSQRAQARANQQQMPYNPPVLDYNSNPGQQNDGYYDAQGNYIYKTGAYTGAGNGFYPPPEGPPPAHLASGRDAYELKSYQDAGPPAGPPPPQSAHLGYY